MEFEWDDAKSASNIDKHGIDFDTAARVFLDPHASTTDVTRPEHGELRFKSVGMVDDRIIAVIFTWRGSARRIISARRSRRNERRDYAGPGETP